MNRAALFLVLCFLLSAAGCGDPPARDTAIIRLAAPDRIAEARSDAWHVLVGPESMEGGLLGRWEGPEGWHRFSVSGEFGHEPLDPGLRLPPIPLGKDGKSLSILPKTGVARLIPVQPGARVLLELKGDFQAARQVRISVVKLTSLFEFPEGHPAGVLNACLSGFGQGIVNLTPEKKDHLSAAINITPEIRALVIMVAAARDKAVELSWVKATALDENEGSESSEMRQRKALVTPFMIGGILRPSLAMTPRTEVVFKPIRLPAVALFTCHLGMATRECPAAELRLHLEDDRGARHEIFTWQPRPDEHDWIPLERDLSAWSGKEVKLAFTFAWTGDPAQGPAPRLCVGAPMIRSPSSQAGRPRYNVILVSLDTLRADHLGCYGYPRPVSPSIDKLAGECLRFENAFSHAPYTLPSHASLFTSLYPSVHGAEDRKYGVLPGDLDLMAELLAQGGMRTASFNGGGFMSHEFGFHRGFDLYCEVDPLGDRYLGGWVQDIHKLADGSIGSFRRTLDWMESVKSEPFFLFLHTFMVHDYLPPDAYEALFRNEERAPLAPGKDSLDQITKKHNRGETLSFGERQYMIDMYDGGIRAADDMVGELLTFLDEQNLAEETILIITSDHGEEFLDHGELFHHYTVYNEMIHIPLIMRVPGLAGGKVIPTYVRHVDLLPTLLELLGMDSDPARFNGASLAPLLQERRGRDRPVFAEVNLAGTSQRKCLIQDGWKFVEGSSDPTLTHPAPAGRELFRLADDPTERNSLTETSLEEVRRLQGVMKGMTHQLEEMKASLNIKDASPNQLSPELLELLKQQGYL